MKIQNVKEVVQVSSSFWKCCKYCSALKLSEDSVEDQVNHYLRHGLKLLHIGTECSRTVEGEIWQSTVAVLGKDEPGPVANSSSSPRGGRAGRKRHLSAGR